MRHTKSPKMSKAEAVMKWLEEEYEIRSEAELDKALAKTRLNIGIFVSPLPDFPRTAEEVAAAECTDILPS